MNIFGTDEYDVVQEMYEEYSWGKSPFDLDEEEVSEEV